MKTDAVVISFNSAQHLPACLRTLVGCCGEIVVVDNASSDDSVAVARKFGATVIANAANLGFAAAANQGARATRGEYILFLNPDVELIEGFAALEQALEDNNRAGAAAGLLLDQGGKPQAGFTLRALPTFGALAFESLGVNYFWPGNPINRRYRCLNVPLDQPADAEQPPGACLMVRRLALEQAGGWDERFYPLWFEDVDLCRRLLHAGWRILFRPASRWRHAGGHSISRISFAEKQIFWYRNLFCYVQKHMGSLAAPAMRILVCAGVSARMAIALLRPGRKRAWSAYGAVVKMALKGSANPIPPATV